jgi:hypothetical protein
MYESRTKSILYEYGKVINIHNDGTVDVVVGSGVDYYGNPLLLQYVAIMGTYTPKINDYVLISWQGNVPIVVGNNYSNPPSIDYSVVITSPTDIANGVINNDHIKSRSITADRLVAGTITAESGVIGELAVTDANIANLDASKITSGDISADRMKANVVEAINLSAGDISADRLKANVIDAINLSTSTAIIDQAKISNLDASKIVSGTIDVERLTGSVIEAINLSATGAVIDQAKIGVLDASKIVSGDIATDRLTANVIEAINLSASTAVIDQAKIGNLDASKITSGDISTDRLKANVIEAINLSTSTATIDQAKIGFLDASKILTGDIAADRMAANVIEAINVSTSLAVIDQAKIGSLDASKITSGDIATERLQANVIEAINLSTSGAVINQAKIGELDASKIVSGDINTDRLKAHVIDAINLSTSNAVIDQAKIGNLDASKIVTGDILADRMKANVVEAINLSTSTAVIDQAKIGNLDASKITSGNIDTNRLVANVIEAINLSASDAKIDGARIAEATIVDAHIKNLNASKITTGDLSATVMKTNVIQAINLSTTSAVIDGAKIGELDASKITSGDISAERLKASVIEAINLSTSGAVIDSAKIANLDASKIVSGDIATDRLKANVIDAINLSTSTAKIDGAKIEEATITNAHITNLDASKITSGDISTDRLKANVIEAINLSTSNAVIDQAKIADLSAGKITSGVLDTTKVTISSSIDSSGSRMVFVGDGIYMYDTNNNVMARLTPQGFTVHVPGGIKLDNQGSIRLGPTEEIVIDSQGIKAKAGGSEYTGFFTGEGLVFVDPTDQNKRFVINSGQLKITTDGGLTYRTALTADGLYGAVLMDNTLPASKFDTTPPAVPTWREEGVNAVLEQTAETQIVTIVVKWNEVSDSDLEGYKIYLEENNSGSFYPVATVGKTNEYRIRGVRPNTTYRVKVTSFDVQGNECSTQLPADTSLTTYPKTVVTPKDTVAPKTPTEAPEVIPGLKMFAITWNETTQNQDGSPCYDLAYYEVQRSDFRNWAEWVTIATVKGTSIVDQDVEYEIEYKYRYRAVDLSGNTSGWSPEVYAGKPSKVGAADIVVHSITTEHISTAGLSADIIKSGKIKGDLIEANTITADKFESTLYGDITQALRYVESKLRQKVYEWLGTEENYATCSMYGLYAYGNTLMLDTVYHWDDSGVAWDSSYNWDKPVVESGYLESPVLDVGQLYTMLVVSKMSVEAPAGSTVLVSLRTSEDGSTWSEYDDLTGKVVTARYLQFKIEIATSDMNSNVYVRDFVLQCYVDELASHVGAGGDAHALVTPYSAGFMSPADKIKLDGIQAGAEVNQNAYSNITDGVNTASAGSKTDTFKLRSANNILTITVANNDPTHGDNALFTINQGNIDHGSIAGLADDDHKQYVHTSVARTISAVHTFNPSSASAPFVLGSNAQGQLVTGLNADKLDGYDASAFETPSGAQSKVDTHASSKQTHGISGSYYIAKTSRSDQLPAWADIQNKPASYTPSAHKSTHASGGSDPLTPADIGAVNKAGDSMTGTLSIPALLSTSRIFAIGTTTNLLGFMPILTPNLAGFNPPYKAEMYNESTGLWDDVTNSYTWAYLTDLKGTEVAINVNSTDTKNIRLYFDLKGSHKFVTAVIFQARWIHNMSYVKVESSNTSDFSSDVSTRLEWSGSFAHWDTISFWHLTSNTGVHRYVRITLTLSVTNSSMGSIRFRQIMLLSCSDYATMMEGYLPIGWDYTRSITFYNSAQPSSDDSFDLGSSSLRWKNGYFSGNVYVADNKVWHAGNDGASSGLDADLLDGMQPSTSATANTIVQRDSSGNITANTFSGALNGNASTASKLATARTITLSGDISGSTSFDGSSNVTITTTLANSGVTAGTYTKVTVDAKGRVTSGAALSVSDIPAHKSTHASGGSDALTPADIGAVNKAGDTMTGQLVVPSLKAMVNIPSSSPPSAWPTGLVYGVVYNNGYPVPYGTVISIKGTRANSVVQLLQAWPGIDGGEAYLYIRSARDIGTDVFGPWRKVWSENNDGSGSGLDADLLDGTQLDDIMCQVWMDL